MKQETMFTEALRATTTYRLTSGKLELLAGNRGLAVFEKSETRPSVDKWLGIWIGPEGTSLDLSKNGAKYALKISSLDGVETYEGVRQGDRISFIREGKTEAIRAGSGAETGMKWLLEKQNCLIIQTGEGFCRD